MNNNNLKNNNNNLKENTRSTLSLSIVGLLILTGLGVIVYFIFFKNIKKTQHKIGYSYIPKDISGNNESVLDKKFKKVENVNKCIEACNSNIICDGMSFNKNTYDCKGFSNGILIKSEPYILAWEKPTNNKSFISKIILSPSIDKINEISSNKITQPTKIANFMFSCFLNVTNWYYYNHTFWKCIFYKGSLSAENEGNVQIPKTKNWEDIVNVLPQQCIGLWLAPFTNNLRICITTNKTNDNNEGFVNIPKPNTDFCLGNKCFKNNGVNNSENNDNILDTQNYTTISNTTSFNTYLEYFDIVDIPLNKFFFIAINLIGNVMEIYLDGKLNYIINLKGEPVFNNSNLYAKREPSFEGLIKNLTYLPYSASYKEIKKIYNNKP